MDSPSFSEKYENICVSLDEGMREYEQVHNIADYSRLSKFSKLIYWIRINRFLLSKYGYLNGSIVNIQYVSVFYVMLLPFLIKTFDRIILSFWGSDLLRQNRRIQFNDRLHVIRFGNYFLEDIDRAKAADIDEFVRKNNIDKTRKVIAIGYNRYPQHRHIEAIQSIIENNIDADRVFFVIPWTYGPEDDDYKTRIENCLKGNYDHLFLDKHLSDQELVALRKITDVQIIVQTTDALNATMLEIMYSGGEVITGSWLHYKDLYERGVNMWRVDSVSDVGRMLRYVLDEPMIEENRRNNRRLIRELYSWKSVIKDWIDLYFYVDENR